MRHATDAKTKYQNGTRWHTCAKNGQIAKIIGKISALTA